MIIEENRWMPRKGVWRIASASALALLLVACGGENYAQDPADAPPVPKNRDFYDPKDSVFGEDGLSLTNLVSPKKSDRGVSLPVNKYLWQASLDTLSFLPLASTDPFTGVIATDWGANPDVKGERFKVTAYMVRPTLAASSLKVAVFREVQGEGGVWVPAAVSADTATKIEDAILTRARQIRIAEVEAETAS